MQNNTRGYAEHRGFSLKHIFIQFDLITSLTA